jgi:putative transposase
MITYKFKPSKTVESKLLFTLETCRKTYNQALAERIFSWKTFQKGLTYNDQSKILTQFKNEYQKQVYSKIILDISYKNFFSRGGYPRFQGKNHYNFFKLDQSWFKIHERYITISKIGTIKMVKHREIEGNVQDIQIIRRNDNWYISITTDYERSIESNNLLDIVET